MRRDRPGYREAHLPSTMTDRFVIASLTVMFAFFPFYGTFAAFAPHPPTAPLVPVTVAGGFLLLFAVAVCGVGVGLLRRPRNAAGVRLWLGPNVAATFLGSVLGFDPAVGLGLVTADVAGIVAAHGALLGYYREPGAARSMYLGLLLSGLSASVLAIVLVALKVPGDLFAYNHGRAVATFLNPNELAEYLLAYLGAAAGLAMVRRGSWLGWLAAVCVGAGSIALALTYSRWGLVSAGVGIATFALLRRSLRSLWPALAILAVLSVVNASFASTHHEPQDTGSRDVAWRAGIATWLHFPLTGVGPLAFERLYPVMRAPDAPGPNTPVAFDPHDLPLSIAAETGTLGLVAFLAFMISFLRRLPQLAAGADEERRTLALALYAGFVAVTVHMLLNSASIAFALIVQFSALAVAAARWGFEADAAPA